MAKTTPRVICNGRNTASRLETDSPIAVGSKAWFDWVEVPENRAFMFEPVDSSTQPKMWNYSAQKEERREDFYWYAYKRYKGKLYRHYLGQGKELNHEKLLQASKKLVNKFYNPPEVVPHRVKQSSTNRTDDSSTKASVVPHTPEGLSPNRTENSSTTIAVVPHQAAESSPNGNGHSSTTDVELLHPDTLQVEALRAENESLRAATDFWRGRAIWNRGDMLNRQRLRDLNAEVAGLRSQLQKAGELVVKLRAEKGIVSTDTLGGEQQNVGTSSLVPTPPAEPSAPPSLDLETIAAVPDFPDDVRDDLEVIKELSGDDIDLTTGPGEAAEGHASAPPSTEIETAITSPPEAIQTMVSQPAPDATEQPQPESEDEVQAPALRDRILEALEKNKAGANFNTLLELLGLPSDRKTKEVVTEALKEMKADAVIFQDKDPSDKRRPLYRVLSDAEKAALLKKLPLLELLNLSL